ncbi:hypothetical protein K1X12_11155 [Hyphomonas sp. WL0036]|uniref:hypothetical protein n=1 Tax=Hyphomonas sediminis TaxID=2866160 RepID=UPI001C7F220D|nr:hypothetical protein [Hyphomonas sediminis]MBY9067461.1 hypothetical protein [Hyphomonas sediminis]
MSDAYGMKATRSVTWLLSGPGTGDEIREALPVIIEERAETGHAQLVAAGEPFP